MGGSVGPEGTETGPGTQGTPIADRIARLLPILLWVGDRDMARGLRGLTDHDLVHQPATVRTAIHALGRKRNPAAFIVQPQYRLTIPVVAEAVSETCMAAVVSALGEAADEPDRDQLVAAVDEVGGQFPQSMIALVLAYVSVTDMPAADLCDEILVSDRTFTPPGPVDGP